MIKTASSICLLGIILILTSCNTTTATAIGISNPPMQYTYAPGLSPPQVLYSTATDSDNIPTMSDKERDERLAPAIDIPQLQQDITIQQLNVIDDPTIF
jgi:hypothetical protein